MENTSFRETDLPDRLLKALLGRLGAADPAAACETVRAGLRERLEVLLAALPQAERLAQALGAGKPAGGSRNAAASDAGDGADAAGWERLAEQILARLAGKEGRASGNGNAPGPRQETPSPDTSAAGSKATETHGIRKEHSTADALRAENGADAAGWERLAEQILARLTGKEGRASGNGSAPGPRQESPSPDTSAAGSKAAETHGIRKDHSADALRAENGADAAGWERLAEQILARLAGKEGRASGNGSAPITGQETPSPDASAAGSKAAETHGIRKDHFADALRAENSADAAGWDRLAEQILARLAGKEGRASGNGNAPITGHEAPSPGASAAGSKAAQTPAPAHDTDALRGIGTGKVSATSSNRQTSACETLPTGGFVTEVCDTARSGCTDNTPGREWNIAEPTSLLDCFLLLQTLKNLTR